jgi:hypothetical protein
VRKNDRPSFVHFEAHPAKQPVLAEPLSFGIDIDGTISQAPRHFRWLIDALLRRGDNVYIITARPENRVRETEAFLASFGIGYTELVLFPMDWTGTIADFKVKVVLERGVHMMIDDDIENCWAIEQRTPALAAHMLPIPEMAEAHEVKEKIRHEMEPSEGTDVTPGGRGPHRS